MKLLIYSRAFLPLVGGLEMNVSHLAEEVFTAGHQVTVLTTTPGPSESLRGYKVVRRPGVLEFLRWVRWCDVFHQPNVSLRGLWPLLLVRRPWVVSHHSWYRRADGRVVWRDRLKRGLLSRAAGSIAVSRAIAADLPFPARVIENSYRDDLFRFLPGVPRSRDLVFVGRLVSDKGVALLLNALACLRRVGFTPNLTIIGDGPESDALVQQAAHLGLAGQVQFLGTRTDQELVRLLNEHRILVAPSLYDEPFGIVALEGIASGCVVVGSSGGGLADAIGPCGLTFPNGDVEALCQTLHRLLEDEGLAARFRLGASAHLAKHRAAVVTAAYLDVFETARGLGR